MSCNWCGEHKSQIQILLDSYNKGDKSLADEIKNLRGEDAPICWGEDDCSTMMLVHCPWSIDCGS